ncbi:MAG: MATE family efflux transporter [Paracoccaceae bacterium]|uniref:MATE family efflux transporter n=1 Tax=unclassified Seohaeicola TaxID=2641111 RepID=UPI00237BEC12|nr:MULTISPECIES: MATE family efflux transporter [unclassified Seohaeicola]MDD9706840.1 MATE family efflux transporter [Seohaeicola sp. 4SK31]MDD9735076.1 MATE family efflux transporter [Seohaeicola sp. SP36]MDF1709259.1 MATE family efflux transporter [Paracoccaceae bacterium]MDM7968573.1 MATE family efflux transporter [Paracoccaceae bacterium]
MSIPMTPTQHMRAIAVLGLPLILSHVAQFSISLTDALMLGWYDVTALAAQVLAGMVFFVLFLFGSGFAWAVMPMVAEAESAGQSQQVRRVTRMAMWLSILFGAVSMPLMIWSEALLLALGQTEEVAGEASRYLNVAGWGIFPALLVMVLKSYLAALERTQVVLWVTIGAVLVNVIVNYALIFGNWGAPEMGIVGAAWASVSVQIVSLLLLAIYAAVVTREHALFIRFWRPDWEAFGQVFRLGWPIGITTLAEVGLFAAASVMMGWLGTLPLAAHGIALQVASLVFMIHLGLGNVATVRAGRALGVQDWAGLRLGAQVVVALSLLLAGLTVVFFLLMPEFLMGLFLSPDEPDRAGVIAIGVVLLAAAALFQLADAAQVMALSLLRGVQDTKVPMIIAALSYWALGMPVAYVLGFVLGWGGVGIWLGLAVGLAGAGVFMMLRFWGVILPRLTAQR